MTGNWKTNQGSAMLEQMPITEKYKNWIDEVIALFIESPQNTRSIETSSVNRAKQFPYTASDAVDGAFMVMCISILETNLFQQ